MLNFQIFTVKGFTFNRNHKFGSKQFGSEIRNYVGSITVGELPETMRKLCLSTKFPHQEIRFN